MHRIALNIVDGETKTAKNTNTQLVGTYTSGIYIDYVKTRVNLRNNLVALLVIVLARGVYSTVSHDERFLIHYIVLQISM